MKTFLLTGFVLISFFGRSFSQCAGNGLKIQSASCEPPRNLVVNAVSCSSVNVNWQGNAAQTYLVKSSFTDPVTNSIVEAEETSIVCDGKGNCGVSIPAKERTGISWSVQAVCLIEGAALYSATVNGPGAVTPFCGKETGLNKNYGMRAYPNPAVDYMDIEYGNSVTGAIECRILDIAGKQVYKNSIPAAGSKTNRYYKLDLRSLPAGVYLLEVHSGSRTDQVKIVKLHKN